MALKRNMPARASTRPRRQPARLDQPDRPL